MLKSRDTVSNYLDVLYELTPTYVELNVVIAWLIARDVNPLKTSIS